MMILKRYIVQPQLFSQTSFGFMKTIMTTVTKTTHDFTGEPVETT